MIGSLFYLTANQPDIMFYVWYYARHQTNPREPHMIVVKNMFRDLHKTTPLGLCGCYIYKIYWKMSIC